MQFSLTEDQSAIQETVRVFAQERVAPRAAQLDREGRFPTELFRELAGIRVTAVPFAESWGGMGLGTFEAVLALEQLAQADQSLAVSTMVSMAAGLTLQRFGTERQKAEFLPDIVSGHRIGALAGTEPNAGSDTAGFRTRAEFDGKQWRIDGEKAFITNAGTEISSFALVLAVSSVSGAKKSFTLFLVPVGTPGFTVGTPYRKMGWKSSDTRPLHFADCRVGPENVVGEVHKGRLVLHRGYQQARVFLSACSLGLAQASLDQAVAYARERQAFGGSIGRLQLVQKMIADMCVKVETARLVVYKAAWLADQGTASGKDLAIAKYYATEIASECANAAIQVHGGFGFTDECPASRYLRDNRVCTIGDGSSQIQSLLIARELGLDVSFT